MRRGELYRRYISPSIPKSSLTSFVGTLSPDKIAALNRALAIAIGVDTPAEPC
jgi:hypothetical protein